MAIVTNTFTRYSDVGIREELADVIFNISPQSTPFVSNIGRETVRNTFFEILRFKHSLMNTLAH